MTNSVQTTQQHIFDVTTQGQLGAAVELAPAEGTSLLWT